MVKPKNWHGIDHLVYILSMSLYAFLKLPTRWIDSRDSRFTTLSRTLKEALVLIYVNKNVTSSFISMALSMVSATKAIGKYNDWVKQIQNLQA